MALKEKVKKFNDTFQIALAGVRPASQTSPETATPQVEGRTSCSPTFSESDKPVDLAQTILPSEVLSMDQFESGTECPALTTKPWFSFCVLCDSSHVHDRWGTRCLPRILAKAPATSNPKVWVCISKGHEVWLLNATAEDLTLTAGELFGFGLGSATETPVGLGLRRTAQL